VQLVSVPDAGVPNTGATKAVPEGRVTVPVKVGLAIGAHNAPAASALEVSVATADVAKLSAFDCAVAADPETSAPIEEQVI
jgi:hypothetical protein